jgi:hypothetical protein
MSLLEEYGVSAADQSASFVKILSFAPSGVGKTSLGATMPGRTLVLAGEKQGGLSIKRRAAEIGKDPEKDVIIVHLEDKYDRVTGQLRVTAFELLFGKKNVSDKDKTEGRNIGILAELERGMHPEVSSLVFDSLSDFQNLLIRTMKQGKGGLEKTLTQQEWGYIIDQTRELCIRLRNMQMHVYVIALATSIQDNDNKMYWRPALSGKKLPDDLPQYFNLVVFPKKTRVRGDQNKSTYIVVTDGGDEAYTKGHPALLPDEEPNISMWVEKINTYGQAHGEGSLESKSGVTTAAAAPKAEAFQDEIDIQIEALFDKLGAPPAKRDATRAKYQDRAQLHLVLAARVAELDKSPPT